ncbi:heme utilization/adhesion protein [Isoalcanivorax pacificus W11-5]|uniref:Heme utilization/adhesion protein n=1 Tax=Isoalcanivorax pacificus W11-5 TaxID=391936 RepID=A0A0B4XSD0_9GAMM|nr:hypothetical protein [Isoalcanivorax pacificus]AJD49665.1 heme utilization/adhesion protein [Isoalcanivorax pacificus W11-5]
MKAQSLLVSSLVALSVALSGCGGGGGGSRSGGTPPSSDIEGAAVKGILKQADVALYQIVDGMVADEALQTTTTDNAGRYSLDIDYTGPALITITGNADATMVCDVPAGCDDGEGGTAAFGAEVPFGMDMTLEAMAVLDGGAVSINVTPLTHLAAAKARSALLNDVAIHLANSHVANLFGVTGELTALPVVDITDAAALEAANANAQKGALLAAALYGAALEEGQTLDELATAFINTSGGQFYGEESINTGVDLAEIYATAQAALTESGANLAGVSTTLSTALAAAQQLGEELTQAAPSDTAALANLAKAKAFVGQVRTLGTSFITEASAEAFADELGAAGTLLSADAEILAQALGYAVNAIAEVHAQRADNGALTSPQTIAFEMAEVEVTFVNDTYTVTDVSGVAEGLEADLSATFVLDYDCTGNACVDPEMLSGVVYSETETTNADLQISGVVSLPALKLEIVEGVASGSTVSSLTDQETDTGNYEFEGTSEEDFTGDAEFDLTVRLVQLDEQTGEEPADGVVLQGQLGLEVSGLHTTSYEEYENACDETSCTWQAVEDETFTFGIAALTFSGMVETANNALSLNFAFEADANGYVLEETSSVSETWCSEAHMCGGSDSGWEQISEETAGQFIEGNFSLIVTVALAGIAEESRIELTGARSALTAGNVAVNISYPGKSLVISAPLTLNPSAEEGEEEVTTSGVTITNQDGVVAVLQVDASGDLFGNIKVGSAVYATITEPNLIKVTYVDGTFESIQ